MNKLNQIAQSMDAAMLGLSSAAQSAIPVFQQMAQATHELEGKLQQLDPLRKMGFDDAEREQIIDIATGLGQSPTELGRLVMSLQSIPLLDARDFFHFRWQWPTVLKCNLLLALALVIVAVGS